jgi:hypothetical protein
VSESRRASEASVRDAAQEVEAGIDDVIELIKSHFEGSSDATALARH